ncbi:opacity protein [Sphingomonas qilianensis]|uniref:Opacity protein n=1 Tax=Sphingomonas qilianensis TaxID=1736690 RepID=A0ABU9XVQ4_9SPHN
MRMFPLAAAVAAATLAVPAFAQDMSTTDTTTTTVTTEPTAPDGTRAFGIEPYVGVMGTWQSFDNEAYGAGVPRLANGERLKGWEVTGVAGFNVPLGPVFIGAEGNVAKGVSGDIDWEYGAAGRFGVRAGESGMIYGKVGYQWVNFDRFGKNSPDFDAMTYGIGFEVGPKEIGLGGITGNSGVRLRGEVSTFGNAHSLRPSLGIVTHF